MLVFWSTSSPDHKLINSCKSSGKSSMWQIILHHCHQVRVSKWIKMWPYSSLFTSKNQYIYSAQENFIKLNSDNMFRFSDNFSIINATFQSKHTPNIYDVCSHESLIPLKYDLALLTGIATYFLAKLYPYLIVFLKHLHFKKTTTRVVNLQLPLCTRRITQWTSGI